MTTTSITLDNYPTTVKLLVQTSYDDQTTILILSNQNELNLICT